MRVPLQRCRVLLQKICQQYLHIVDHFDHLLFSNITNILKDSVRVEKCLLRFALEWLRKIKMTNY